MKNLKITSYTTDYKKNLYLDKQELSFLDTEECMHVINVFSDLQNQEIEGFGGAFTEATAHTFEGLTAEAKKDFVEGYFGKSGLEYNLCRIPVHSCDFSLGNYTYVEEGDSELNTFSIAHDEKEIIPLIQAAKTCAEEEIVFLSSPWSPPAFMKDTNQMNGGGKLLAEHYQNWANYYVRFIQEYKKKGIDISYITVQNEPLATQTWESCIYEAREEGMFVKEYLAPTLKREGLSHIQIFIWDHNKEEMYQRVKETFSVEGCEELVSGVAMHWYTGDHFGAIEATRKAFPDKKIFFTEGCVEYSRFSGASDIENAEMYAHDILGDLNAGANAFIDWNMLLDENGGPNHVGNLCAAPTMANGSEQFDKRLSYYYIGHFSKFIKKGARQCLTSTYTDKIEALACVNPDGSRVVVVLNKSDEAVDITVRVEEGKVCATCAGHSIITYIFKK